MNIHSIYEGIIIIAENPVHFYALNTVLFKIYNNSPTFIEIY